MLELFGMSSPNVLKIVMFLEEAQLPYGFHTVNLLAGEQFDPRFSAMNPMRKVPVIVDTDGPDGDPITVFESAAILIYLAQKHGRFLPSLERDRLEVLQWLMVEVASAGPILGQYNHYLRFAQHEVYSLNRYRTLSGRAYDMFDERLRERAYIAGGDYSLADISLFPWVEAFYDFHGMRRDEHPNLMRWHDRVSGRAGTKRALAKYADIKSQDPTFSQPPAPDALDRVLGRGRHIRA